MPLGWAARGVGVLLLNGTPRIKIVVDWGMLSALRGPSTPRYATAAYSVAGTCRILEGGGATPEILSPSAGVVSQTIDSASGSTSASVSPPATSISKREAPTASARK